MFVDVVAHGGNLLLNVGPNADGAIPWVQAQRLLALGWWLRTNGDAIYGTRPWTRTDGTTAEGHDIRYTTRDGEVFAIVCGTPGERGRGARRHALRRARRSTSSATTRGSPGRADRRGLSR